MKIFIKIAIRILPVVAVLTLLYIGYLHFWGDRSQNTWFGRKYSQADIKAESGKAYRFFESYFDSILSMSPEQQSLLGLGTNKDKWDDISEEALDRRLAFNQKSLQYLLDSIKMDRLDSANQISYMLLENHLNTAIEADKYRHYDYPVNQVHGLHSETVSFLINVHRIENKEDALAYIARLKGIRAKFDDLIHGLKIREINAVLLPVYLYPPVLDVCNNIISDYPYSPNPAKKNVLYEDFASKIADCEGLQNAQRTALLDSCKTALVKYVKPAYLDLIEILKKQQEKANSNAGCWKMSLGEDYYAFKLKEQTSTQLAPNDVYDLGNDEIQRIHKEMELILKRVGFKGDLQAFFAFVRDNDRFYYPNTAQGGQAYIRAATAIIDSIRPKLSSLFYEPPKAALVIKAVEPYREKSVGKAFYEAAAAEGNRPGTYYINTYDMRMLPKYQMEALAYHEGIPGKHLQSVLTQKLTNLPRFRRYNQIYAAYAEGWGLYSEYIPKEMGFYTDPYSDFGRLAMELWRACRLVVDVGIHSKRWTKEQAVNFYQNNTPNSLSDCIKMAERHIVMPAQATTYKIGMISILELRQKAKDALGEKFDIRDFHDIILKNGAVPLNVLEDLVDAYIKTTLRES